MVVWHVCSLAKFEKYQQAGAILAPVRAWENERQAARFSRSTGRPIILRLKFPDDAPKYEGHFNEARQIWRDYRLPTQLLPAARRKQTNHALSDNCRITPAGNEKPTANPSDK